MSSFSKFKRLFQQIQVVKSPKHRLATFGTSQINYTLVTNVQGMPDRTRLRMGHVTAEKPLIITPHMLQEKFHGFGDESREFADWLTSQYGEALRGLEYQFRNEPLSTRIELGNPNSVLKEMVKDFDPTKNPRSALIRGSDNHWPLSIMKFIVEETLTSFASNVRELHERGFFEGDKRLLDQQHREIRYLFGKAHDDKSLLPVLGQKLKEYGLFEYYQDEFFRLVN